MKLAVLMTCHNRKEMTLSCLSKLLSQLDKSDKVFLTDDGSTDGTGEAISRLRHGGIEVIHGDGTLYWARGMELAWRTAQNECEWDGYLWLNDDAVLEVDALHRLKSFDDGESIVIGNLCNAAGNVIYGIREEGLFTGNCVLVPRKVYERIGMICGKYAHAWADSDYAQRAKRLGVRIVCCGVVGQTEGHSNRPNLKGRTLWERLRLLRDPKGWNVHDLWLYRKRNWGTCRAIVSCVHLILHVIVGER